MITLKQSQAMEILSGAKQLLKDVQYKEINKAILQRYQIISVALASLEDIEGVDQSIDVDFEVFPFSKLPEKFKAEFFIYFPSMGLLFDLDS